MYICFCVNVTYVTLQTWLLHKKYLSENEIFIFLLNFYDPSLICIANPITIWFACNLMALQTMEIASEL